MIAGFLIIFGALILLAGGRADQNGIAIEPWFGLVLIGIAGLVESAEIIANAIKHRKDQP